MEFVYNAEPGAGFVRLRGPVGRRPKEVGRLGLAPRIPVLSTPQQEGEARRLSELIGECSAGVLSTATMHTPITVTDEALAVVSECRVDGLVAVGGGSTTGLSKAIALRTDLPQIVIPTTYAGSEMTPILGETKRRHGKTTAELARRCFPEVVIYDVDLTLTACRHGPVRDERDQRHRPCGRGAVCARGSQSDHRA